MLRLIVPALLLAALAGEQAEAFSNHPGAVSAIRGARTRSLGARGLCRTRPSPLSLRSVAVNEDHSPTAMDWDDLGSKPWGSIETDYMYVAETKLGEEWKEGEIKPYGDLSISPRSAVMNYGQGVFEGMKAQRTEEGKIVIFRPDRNARRVAYGCERLCMPPVPEDIFINAVKETVLANAAWVPPHGKGSLYIRPLVVGSGAILGLAPAPSYTFTIYVSPVGSYFKGNQMTPISLKIETEFARAAPGGSGGAKCIGNYAPTLLPQQHAKAEGFDNCLYLDAVEQKYLEEVGTSNIFVVKDNTIYTPPCSGGGSAADTILEGVTRESVLQVAKDAGYKVVEERIEFKRLWDAEEAFTVGTAVVISPIGSVSYQGDKKEWTYAEGAGPCTTKIYNTLTGMQVGKVPDPYGWVTYLD